MDGSDDFPDFNWVIFGFQPLIFQGVYCLVHDGILTMASYI